MGVYINMEMPKETYAHCMLIKDIDGSVQLHVCTKNSEDLSEWEYYNLISVPPHGDLIDKKIVSENLASVLNKKNPPFSYPDWNDAIIAMLTAPTVIPASEEGE